MQPPNDADAREVTSRKVDEPEHDTHDERHAERDEVQALQTVCCQVEDREDYCREEDARPRAAARAHFEQKPSKKTFFCVANDECLIDQRWQDATQREA